MDKQRYTFKYTPTYSKTFNSITKTSVSSTFGSENHKLASFLFVKIKKLVISFFGE